MTEAASTVHQLAIRAILLVLPERDFPDLVGRVTDFSQDRGAVGLLLRQYEDGKSLEDVSLSYWNSRIERLGSRLEDIVTTVIISVFCSFIAGVAVEMWKGNFGALGRIFKADAHESLVSLARALPSRREDLSVVLSLYAAKLQGTGVVDQQLALELYECVARGGTIGEFIEQKPRAALSDFQFEPLDFAEKASRGVILTELQREMRPVLVAQGAKYPGLPLCPKLAFGEVISLFDVPDLGLGPNSIAELKRKLLTSRLHPEAWPRGAVFPTSSPKILIMNEGVLRRLREAGEDRIVAQIAGAISTDSGMTSHLAVVARSLGRGAVTLAQLSEAEITKARFALLSAGEARLYFERPSMLVSEFDRLISLTPRSCRQSGFPNQVIADSRLLFGESGHGPGLDVG